MLLKLAPNIVVLSVKYEASDVGSLGASLGAMVANLSSNKRGWENQVEMFSHIADQINVIRNELLLLVDEDSNAFNMIMLAFKLPNNSEKEKKIRLKSINESTIYAAKVPLKVMEKSYECYDLILKLAKEGNQNSISDAGVACLCVYTAIYGAYLNVKINLKDLPNDKSIIERASDILVKSSTKKRNILNYIQGII